MLVGPGDKPLRRNIKMKNHRIIAGRNSLPEYQDRNRPFSVRLTAAASVTLLSASLLLSACQSAAPVESSEAPSFSESVSETDTEAETASSEEVRTEAESSADPVLPEPVTPDIPPEEGLVRSPLTYEWIPGELAEKRPIAVMYPIDKKAQPQYGLDRVEVFYEIMEEGDMSRQMGILLDWEDLERIGNVRSTREYFVYEALEWDSILIHFGGPEVFVKDILTRPDVDNINGVDGVMGSSYGAFYRVPANSNSMHRAYTDGAHILSAIEKAGFAREHRPEYYDPDRWKFAREPGLIDLSEAPGSVPAFRLDMKGCYPVTGSVLEYNEEDGLYYRSIYGEPQCDAITGEQLSFTNILIKSETSGQRGAGYLYYHSLDGGHDAWYLTGGRMIHGTWAKATEYQTTRFYDDNGAEIVLNPGRTMVFIARTGQDHFMVDGNRTDL
jgi:hypothetical protein